MNPLGWKALLDRLEELSKSASDRGKNCLDCRDIEEYRSCNLPNGGVCASGWHQWLVETPFAYRAVTAFEKCPHALTGLQMKAREVIRLREQQEAEALAVKMGHDQRVISMAEEILKRKEPTT